MFFVSCLVVSLFWLCPLSFSCVLPSGCLCLMYCSLHVFSCAPPPRYLTWPPPSSLSSPVPRLVISVCVFSLCVSCSPGAFIESVCLMFLLLLLLLLLLLFLFLFLLLLLSLVLSFPCLCWTLIFDLLLCLALVLLLWFGFGPLVLREARDQVEGALGSPLLLQWLAHSHCSQRRASWPLALNQTTLFSTPPKCKVLNCRLSRDWSHQIILFLLCQLISHYIRFMVCKMTLQLIHCFWHLSSTLY